MKSHKVKRQYFALVFPNADFHLRKQNLFKSLLYDNYCNKQFSYINSFNFHMNLMRLYYYYSISQVKKLRLGEVK